MIIKTEEVLNNWILESLVFNYIGVNRNEKEFDKICEDGQVSISLKINEKEYNILDFLNEVIKTFDSAVEEEVKNALNNKVYTIIEELNNISDSIQNLDNLIEKENNNKEM